MSTVTTNFSGGSLDAALLALELTLAAYGGIELLAVLLDQDYDSAGELREVVDVSFEITGRSGVFTVYPPFAAGWEYVAIGRVTVKVAEVEAIYQGLANATEAGLVTPIGSLTPGVPV
jgi:hypothetical protein